MIYEISLEDVLDEEILLHEIYADLNHDYYWSDDFSPQFYITLAKLGFITVAMEDEEKLILLPQIQTHYALLEHKDLHISHHVKKLLQSSDKYSLTINQRFSEVIEGIKQSYEDCWFHDQYERLLVSLHEGVFEDFQMMSTELIDTHTNTLVCGELGYITNNIYTGLTKFSLKDKEHTNWGTLQRVLLTQHLQKQGVLFSNLGQPKMQYKLDLGAIVYPRKEFLQKFGIIG